MSALVYPRAFIYQVCILSMFIVLFSISVSHEHTAYSIINLVMAVLCQMLTGMTIVTMILTKDSLHGWPLIIFTTVSVVIFIISSIVTFFMMTINSKHAINIEYVTSTAITILVLIMLMCLMVTVVFWGFVGAYDAIKKYFAS